MHWNMQCCKFSKFMSSTVLLLAGVDILKLVAAQVGAQWVDLYQLLADATEREVTAFSNSYLSDHERAYAALQHWTIRDGEANLPKLINALHRQRRIDVVAKIRWVMEDNPQVGDVLFHLQSRLCSPVCAGDWAGRTFWLLGHSGVIMSILTMLEILFGCFLLRSGSRTMAGLLHSGVLVFTAAKVCVVAKIKQKL